MARTEAEAKLERRNARRKRLGLSPVKRIGGLADNINKIIDGCPSCKKRRDSKTLDR